MVAVAEHLPCTKPHPHNRYTAEGSSGKQETEAQNMQLSGSVTQPASGRFELRSLRHQQHPFATASWVKTLDHRHVKHMKL